MRTRQAQLGEIKVEMYRKATERYKGKLKGWCKMNIYIRECFCIENELKQNI